MLKDSREMGERGERGGEDKNLSRTRCINLVDNKAAANDANEYLVDEYGHNNTLVPRWSCIWSLSA